MSDVLAFALWATVFFGLGMLWARGSDRLTRREEDR